MEPQERRKYRRLSTEVKVDISYTDPKTDVTSLLTEPVSRNLSAGGLLIRYNKELAVGSEVVVKFVIPSEKRYVMTFARVVRVDAVEQGRLYDIGIAFLDIRPEDRELIDRYVTSRLDEA